VVSRVAYGTCVGSWERVQRYVLPRVGGKLFFGTSGQSSIAQAYNSILVAAAGHDLSMLILQHDDLEITDPDAELKFLEAFADPRVAIAGVAGGKGGESLAWWETETVGHQLTDSRLLDFGPRTGEVALVEGSVMAFSPWAIEYLGFDENFRGFHSCDEVAATARSWGKRVVVVDVDTHHHTTLGFKSEENRRQWTEANEVFRKKWGFA
jgi:hypothetical protein